MSAILEVKNLVKSFDGRKVLEDINLKVNAGETLVIMGGSGCGKTTLLRLMVGMHQPDSGQVFLKGQDIHHISQEQFHELKQDFGMLFQSAALFNSMTIGENVALPLVEHTELEEDVIKIAVKMKLEMVGLTGFEHLKPAQISGGMKKRVGLARAIALDPQVVFYDEPGAGLDPITTAVIDQLIIDLSKKLGITSVIVTHEMESAFRVADRMIMLHEGRVQFSGTPKELKETDNALVRQFVEGSPTGPIPMQTSGEDYLKNLMGDE